MPPRSPRRRFIGTSSGLSAWQRVYETTDALEVDEGSGFTGTRQRVFYDEVVLVTYHSFIGWALAAVSGALATVVGLVALIVALAGEPEGTVAVFLGALVPLALAAVRVAVKVDAVTVYGRRSKARVSFWLRKGRARETYQRLCARVRHAQERAARSAPPAAAAPAPPAEAVS